MREVGDDPQMCWKIRAMSWNSYRERERESSYHKDKILQRGVGYFSYHNKIGSPQIVYSAPQEKRHTNGPFMIIEPCARTSVFKT